MRKSGTTSLTHNIICVSETDIFFIKNAESVDKPALILYNSFCRKENKQKNSRFCLFKNLILVRIKYLVS